MKAVEVSGFFDETGTLTLDEPPQLKNQRVKIIVLIPESDEIEDAIWLKSISGNSAFDFLEEPAEDIYSLKDGEPMDHEV
ncbi:MAG: hypothetical protein AAF399_20410 [Bacteroidota bacterium]